MINWAIIREPYNWVIVAFILAGMGIAVTVLANGGRLPDQAG